MSELTELMARLKMKHLTDSVENLLAQAVKEELNERETLVRGLNHEWNGRRHKGLEFRLKKARLPWVKTLKSTAPAID